MSNPTQEQIDTINTAVQAAKEHGFISHLVGRGKSASEIRRLHARYRDQDQKRAVKYASLRQAILGDD